MLFSKSLHRDITISDTRILLAEPELSALEVQILLRDLYPP